MDINELKNIIKDEDRIFFGSQIPEEYLADTFGRFRTEADALVFPLSTEEVSSILKFAHEHKIPVTPRGAGTNLVGSTVPLDKGIIVDMSKMNNILEIDEETMTATVEAGILLCDFQEYLKNGNTGLFYPPDPGEKASSIGGNIATNAGGMRAVKYGVTRDYVRGLEVVKADGTVLHLGGKNVKDASGLSLKHLFIGSEGTLGIITKCILKLVPAPVYSLSVLVPFKNLEDGISNVLRILKSNTDPTAVEFVERNVIELGEKFCNLKYPCPEAGSYIILTFDGNESSVRENAEKVRKLTLEHGAMDYIILDDPQLLADIWKVRGCLVKAVDAVSKQEPVDIVVPINKIVDIMAFVNELSDRTKMKMIGFGHAGDGNVHLCVLREDRDEETWDRELHENMDILYSKAYELGGLTSGEHGIGISKQRYFLKGSNPANIEMMNEIKDALDPLHILNNKKVYMK